MKTTADADEYRLDSTAFKTLSRQDAVTIEALGTQRPTVETSSSN